MNQLLSWVSFTVLCYSYVSQEYQCSVYCLPFWSQVQNDLLHVAGYNNQLHVQCQAVFI